MILLTEDQINKWKLKGAAKFGAELWPQNKVYYTINENIKNPAYDHQDLYNSIIESIKYMHENTTLKFVERKSEENYIEFIWDIQTTGSSNYGMLGKKQFIKVANWAKMGEILHEIGHAIGLSHEHTRSDRSKYIDVKVTNIKAKYLYWFAKELRSINISYFDFGSLMMYPSFCRSWTVNNDVNKPLMTRLNGTTWQSNRSVFSYYDLVTINDYLYPNIYENKGTFYDFRDGNKYDWIKMGNQIWMADNLAYLPAVNPSSAESNTQPCYYVYGYNGTNVLVASSQSNYKIYGVLYNWPAAMAGKSSSSTNPSGVQGICPQNWHLPSDAEWKQLEMYLGMSQTHADISGGCRGTDQGTQLKSQTGFGGLLAGDRNHYAGFFALGEYGYWWSSTEYSSTNAWFRCILYNRSCIERSYGNYKYFGFSVRCVRDN